VLRDANAHEGPILLVMNHASWWDPLIALMLGDSCFTGRSPSGPIDMDQWTKFGFMKRLGIFGLDPTHPGALDALIEHSRTLFQSDPTTVLGITAQGRFADVREQISLRPGAASIAAANPEARVLVLAIEYAFWTDRRPEVFMRADPCPVPSWATTTSWHRTLTRGLGSTLGSLSDAVIARDPDACEPLIGARGPAINPIYDAWIRLRGLSPQVRQREIQR